jgi:Mycothiol maleylpyruvate isomerase N-terminal domain
VPWRGGATLHERPSTMFQLDLDTHRKTGTLHRLKKHADQVFAAYTKTRARMAPIAKSLSPTQLDFRVPACPLWTTFDLIAHVVSLPAALAQGQSPSGSIEEWMQGLIDDRRNQNIDGLIDEWHSLRR